MRFHKKEEDEKIRLNLVISPQVKKNIDSLQELSGAASVTEVLRKAIGLYNFVIDNQLTGGAFVLKKADGTEEKLVIV